MRSQNMIVPFLFIIFCHFCASVDFPRNRYVYSVERDWILQQERNNPANKLPLDDNETIVNQYLSYLKSDEFNQTKPEVPPSRPIEETLDNILNSTLYKTLRKLPKGGNMHIHENLHQHLNLLDHVLSKRILLDIVFDSEDFEHLWIVNESAPRNAWRMDFFINPPADQSYVNVKNNTYYTKELILSKQTFMNIMDNNAKRYPTDTDMRWKQMNPLWGRGSSQLINNIKIKREYVKEMLRTSLEEGVQYLENRVSLYGGLYELDTDPVYKGTNGKRFFDSTGEAELNVTIDVIQNFTSEHPDFIGMKRIIYSSRGRSSIEDVKRAIENVLKFHRRYPSWIVGYDLVAEEDAGRSHLFFLDSFLTLYDDATKRKKIDLYLHTAETNFATDHKISQHQDDPVAAMQNTYDAIVLGARRVGHGLGFIKHPYLMKILKERSIAVESCPVSNQLLGFQPDLRNHPAQTYLRYGIPVVLGSDDPGTFGYDHFTVDWYMAYFGWGLDLADLKLMAENSLQYSAMSSEEKRSAKKKFESLWKRYIEDTKKQACQTTFEGTPVFAKVLPIEGARSVSTKVYIYGANFQAGICKNVTCIFGKRNATKTKLVTSELIICESPPIGGSRRRRHALSFGMYDTEELDNGVRVPVSIVFDRTPVYTGHNFTYKYEPYVHPPTPVPTVPKPQSGATMTRCSVSSFILLCAAYLAV